MKLLLLQSSAYLPSLGGANKANRLLLEQLAARGHECHAVGTAGGDRVSSLEACLAGLEAAGARGAGAGQQPGVVSFRHAGVAVEAVLDGARLRAHAAARLRELAPDRVLVSSEDPAQMLLEEAVEASPRTVYFAHTTLHLPFGPDGFLHSPGRTGLLRRAAGIVAVSGYIRDYIRRWAGPGSTVLRFPVYGSGPWPATVGFDRGFVTLINPCAVKGISLFLELARRLPDVAFAAVPTWGTTAADRAALAALPNIHLLPPAAQIDEIFAQTRVLLVPSLWGEAFGQVAVEAMLRGIPVLASDAGGLPEAMLGVDYVLPVRKIERYEERFDERKIPVAVVPEQDLAPWEAALRRVLGDRALHGRLSREARRAALGFVAGLGIEPFERFLADLGPAASAPPPRPAVGRRLDGLSNEKLELLARLLKKGAPADRPVLPRQARSAGSGSFPLSFTQSRMWFLHQLEPDQPLYNESFAVGLRGPLRPAALAAGLREVARRHEMLRTRFATVDGEPVQVVSPQPADGLGLRAVDLRALPEAVRRREARRLANAERRRPFDLTRGPLLRMVLIALAPEEHHLVVTVQHIAADVWACGILMRELSALYAALRSGRPAELPELPVQYADFAVWQRQCLTGERLDALLAWWRERLAGLPPLLDLPGDRPRPASPSYRSVALPLVIPAPLAGALRERARAAEATLFMALLAGFQALLSRWSGQEDLAVGSPVANRGQRELEGLIGCFINTLVLRGDLAGRPTGRELLARTREAALGAFSHQDLPFELLVEHLQPERSLSHGPLFQSMLLLQNTPMGWIDLPEVEAEPLPVPEGTARLDLMLSLAETADGRIEGLLEASGDLFDRPTAARLLLHFVRLLEGLAADPDRRAGELPLLTAAERQQLLREWNDAAEEGWIGGPEHPGAHQLFAAQAVRTPEAPAVAFQGRETTYAELASRARSLAAHLRRLGCGPETRVGVALERGLDLPVALLGILEAGAAYVPLDPGYPRERLAFVLEDAAPRVLITHEALLPALPPIPGTVLCLDRGSPPARDGRAPTSRDFTDDRQLAYVLYTSGSTGRPKGVAVSHRALVNFLGAMRRTPGITPGERLLAVTSLAFDIAALEIFLPLTTGGCVELASRAEASDGTLLAARLRSSGAGVMQGTPATWRMLLDAGWDGDPGLRAFCGGEALPGDLAASLASRTRELWNLYGPTETTVWSTVARIAPAGGGAISIGPPIAATRIHLLDRELQTVPLGVPGELWIGGAGLARGYLGRPDLTAERFLPDPFAAELGEPGGRLYRTGDLARHLPGGRMEVLGRIDQQVKLRGFRIELGEIEAAIRRHAGIREAAVVLRNGSLVAYLAAEEIPAAGELRDALRGSLPEPMIPAAFVFLPALPLTPNRKIDRKALPDPEPAGGTGPFVPPRTPAEEVLAGIWAEVLGIERVGAADHFFHLGGHSLLATRVLSRLRTAFGVELPLRELFATPVLADLAARLTALRTGPQPPAPPLPPIAPAPRPGPLPQSFAQQRLWFLDRLEAGVPLYNMPVALRAEGPLQAALLALCLGEVTRRHEALRTVLTTRDGAPVQVIEPARPFALPLVDLSGLPRSRREATALLLADGEAGRPFDLTRDPLLRGLLLRLEGEDHVVALTTHHIAGDGWSMGILVREVTALYTAFAEGRPSPLPELPVQYADFAVWQRSWLHGEAVENGLAFWRRQLAGLPPLLDLPADRPRPAVQSFRGASRPVRLPADLARQAKALGRREGATLFMVLLAAFQSLLARLAGQDDLAVGTPVHGRNRVEVEGLIGFFVNTLVLRSGLAGAASFRELLGRVRETSFAAHAHQDLPFERLVQELAPERSLAQAPLVQVMLALQNAPAEELKIPGLRLRPCGGGRTVAILDLTLSLAEQDGELRGAIEYATDLFDATTIDRLAGGFERLLAAAVAAPELSVRTLPLLSPAERAQILVEWNDTARPAAAGTTLHELFAAQARRTPEAVALVDRGRELLYRELDETAGRWAGELRRRGAGPEVLVGICLERSAGMVAALLAVLRAGAAYLPLDPRLPRQRMEALLGGARATLVISEPKLAAGLPWSGPLLLLPLAAPADGGPGSDPGGQGRTADPENLAYVLFTSGSTGTPKGVAITHRSAVELVRWAGTVFAPEELAGVLASTALSFDLSVFEIFVPLCRGGTVILAQDALELPALLASPGAAGRVTLVNTVPSAMAELVGAGGLGASVRTVNLAGEPLSRALADRIHAVGTVERLWNLYGPSECTTYSTFARVPREGAAAPDIGRPITGTRAYVLATGPEPLPVPVGVAGELHLGGAGLARGYLHRPELTAERFVPDPFGSGGRLYRTGDLVRWSSDGSLHFLGRLDHQVKVRGFRVELGEIEAALARHPEVRDAVVTLWPGEPGARLVAYLVPAGEQLPEGRALRDFLRESLPEPMIPAAFVPLSALPLTPNRKVDRKALPAPEPPRSGEGCLAPRTPVEEILAGLWAGLLGLDRVGAADHFFDLGGHSLLALQMTSRLREAFAVEIPLRTVFEAPRLADLARRIEAARRGGAERTAPPLAPVPREGLLPLSFAQQRLWFIHRLEPGSPLYNMPVALRIAGRLAPCVLALSLQEIVRRHEVLRTVFPVREGAAVQAVQPARPFSLPLVDLAGLPAPRRMPQALGLAGEEARRPFDLARGPLLRGVLLRLEDEDHAVALTLHHIASDGWSMGLLVQEVTALYPALAEGRPSPLPELAVQYGDFAAWQRSWLRDEVLEEEISSWCRQLAGLPPLLELPTDRPRPAVQSFRGASRPARLPADLTRRLETLGRREGATLFMVLLAGFQALLARHSGQEDLAVGTPIAGRNRVEIEGLIGFFVNTLVLRGDLTGDATFRTLLRRTRETALAAYRHQDVPFEKLVQELAPERNLAHAPLFQAVLTLQNAPLRPLDLPGLTVSFLPVETGSAKFDLTLALQETGGALAGSLEHNAGLFDGTTMERLLGHLGRLLEAAAADPDRPFSDLPLLSSHERHQLLVEGRGADSPRSRTAALHHLFEAQAERRPEAVALVFRERSLTYRELDRQADRLAHLLIRRGAGPEVRVGLCLERSAEMVVAILAALKTGGAYVPLDPALPPERLLFQLEDAGVAVLVTQASCRAKVSAWEGPLVCLDESSGAPGVWPATRPAGAATGGDGLAYVLYTSGSTGRPKGVAVTHANVLRLLEVTREPFGFTEQDTWTLFHSYAFDFSVWELWGALAHGGRVVVVPHDVARSPEDFFRLLATERVTVLNQTPSAFRQLMPVWDAAAGEPPPVRWVLFGGEALEMRSLAAWLARRGSLPRLVNLYGITETTVHVTLRPVRTEDTAGASSRIGGPLADLELYVADRGLRPQPSGVPGELCVGGAGLARGYWRRPELTAERFVPDPWSGRPGARLYRSGDLGRRLPDGDLEYLGRLDHQVKIRGLRIELGEIEATLARHPAVRASVVQAVDHPGAAGDRRLAAWVAVAPGASAGVAELRAFLGERLAAYMVPASFVLLDALPLTPNGKVDRAALPSPEGVRPGLEASFVAPRTREEQAVAAVWREVLGVERVGVSDNFFDLGGHSLLMVQVQDRLRDAFAREVPVLDLFQHTTVGALARHLSAGAEETAEPVAIVASESRGEGRRARAGEQQLQRQRRRTGRTGGFES